jgi:hypothetical protein
MIPSFIAPRKSKRGAGGYRIPPFSGDIGRSQNGADCAFTMSLQPTKGLVFRPMRRIVSPAIAGINAVRHLAWYLGYQTAGSRHGLTR